MDEFIKFNNQTAGRDKIFRLCQYTSRMVWYTLEKRRPGSEVASRAKYLDEILGLVRRLMRFGRFYESFYNMSPIMSISDTIIRLTSALARISNGCFMLLDHLVCLDKLKLLPAKSIDAAKWDLLGTRFWLYSILLGLVRDFYDISRIYKEEYRYNFRSHRRQDWSSRGTTLPGYQQSTDSGSLSTSRPGGTTASSQVTKYLKYLRFASHCITEHADVAVDTSRNLLDLLIPLNSLGVVKLSAGTIGFLGSVSTIISAIPQLNPLVKMVPSS